MDTPAISRCAPEDLVPLRWRVLRAGLPIESARFPGDQAGVHFAARVDGEVVGCVSLMAVPYARAGSTAEPAWQLRGMATAERVRGTGVGAALLRAVEEHVRASPTRLLWCNARVPALGFYARHGWGVDSEEFDIPTAGPHRRMSRLLA
jgi:GNAT superfamily N-acetyltransferase